MSEKFIPAEHFMLHLIDQAEEQKSELLYASKLGTIQRLQEMGIPDDQIEELVGLTIRPEHRAEAEEAQIGFPLSPKV